MCGESDRLPGARGLTTEHPQAGGRWFIPEGSGIAIVEEARRPIDVAGVVRSLPVLVGVRDHIPSRPKAYAIASGGSR